MPVYTQEVFVYICVQGVVRVEGVDVSCVCVQGVDVPADLKAVELEDVGMGNCNGMEVQQPEQLRGNCVS